MQLAVCSQHGHSVHVWYFLTPLLGWYCWQWVFNVKFIDYLHHIEPYVFRRSPGRGDSVGHLQIVNVAHVVIGNDSVFYTCAGPRPSTVKTLGLL